MHSIFHAMHSVFQLIESRCEALRPLAVRRNTLCNELDLSLQSLSNHIEMLARPGSAFLDQALYIVIHPPILLQGAVLCVGQMGVQ